MSWDEVNRDGLGMPKNGPVPFNFPEMVIKVYMVRPGEKPPQLPHHCWEEIKREKNTDTETQKKIRALWAITTRQFNVLGHEIRIPGYNGMEPADYYDSLDGGVQDSDEDEDSDSDVVMGDNEDDQEGVGEMSETEQEFDGYFDDDAAWSLNDPWVIQNLKVYTPREIINGESDYDQIRDTSVSEPTILERFDDEDFQLMSAEELFIE